MLTNPATRIAGFDLPVRDEAIADYRARVDAWHDAIAAVWADAIAAQPGARHVALLVWGDPALYDSTLRIASRLRARAVDQGHPRHHLDPRADLGTCHRAERDRRTLYRHDRATPA